MIAVVLILCSAFVFPGIIAKTKAKFSGRKGPSIFQPIYDIIKLLKKGSVYSNSSSYIFQIAIPIYLGAVITSMIVIPVSHFPAIMSFHADFIFFAYIMALGRFFIIVTALDTASPFEGMGANREAFYGLLVEPAFFILLAVFAMFTGHFSFGEIFSEINYDSYFSYSIGIFATYLLAQITFIENSRLPIDDPKTHLELTMVHEVMVLDHSGFDLALIQIANALKFAIFGSLIANSLLDPSWGMWITIPVYLAIQVVFAFSIGLSESFRARLKMAKNPQYIINLSAIASILIFVVMIIHHNI